MDYMEIHAKFRGLADDQAIIEYDGKPTMVVEAGPGDGGWGWAFVRVEEGEPVGGRFHMQMDEFELHLQAYRASMIDQDELNQHCRWCGIADGSVEYRPEYEGRYCDNCIAT